MRPSSHPHASTRLQQSLPVLLSSGRLSAPGRNCCDVTQTCSPMPPGFELLPFGNSSAESQRDSGSKPRVASRELPWEKRVVSANPNGVVARWWSGDALSLGLKIARTLTQGSLADSVAGLEDTIPLGLQNHRSLRRYARLIGIGSFARPLVIDAAPVKGLAWLCWSAPETNPGGIGRQVCVATRRLRIRHWIYVPMYLAWLVAGGAEQAHLPERNPFWQAGRLMRDTPGTPQTLTGDKLEARGSAARLRRASECNPALWLTGAG